MNPATPTFGNSGGGGWGAAELGQLFAGIGQTVASTYQAFNQPRGTSTVVASDQSVGAAGSGVSSQTLLLVGGAVLIVGGIVWALAK